MNVLLSQSDILKKMNDYYLRNKEKKSDSDVFNYNLVGKKTKI